VTPKLRGISALLGLFWEAPIIRRSPAECQGASCEAHAGATLAAFVLFGVAAGAMLPFQAGMNAKLAATAGRIAGLLPIALGASFRTSLPTRNQSLV
jgi:hypothetical protein